MRTSGNIESPRWPRIAGALLCLAIAAVHVIDQGGFPGSKAPHYVGLMYYGLEAAAILTAALLVGRPILVGWLLTAGVAAAPISGYVLSRGPGLPGYTNDKGNWSEPLGLIAMTVESALLLLSVWQLARGAGWERRQDDVA
jgi:hypothetical protein